MPFGVNSFTKAVLHLIATKIHKVLTIQMVKQQEHAGHTEAKFIPP